MATVVSVGGGMNPYPVGSIYLSINSTNPAALFGGTWEQIKDTFLLACGNTYVAGSAGGEAQHTLTVEEMPNHTHATTFYNDDFSNGGDSQTFDRKKQSPGLTYDVAGKMELDSILQTQQVVEPLIIICLRILQFMCGKEFLKRRITWQQL